jgi:hypothetical protein
MFVLLEINMVELAFVQEAEVVLFCDAMYSPSADEGEEWERECERRRTFRNSASRRQTRAHPPPRLRGRSGTGGRRNPRLADTGYQT